MNLLKNTPRIYRLSRPFTLLSNKTLIHPLSISTIHYKPLFTFCDRKGIQDKGGRMMGR